MNINYETVCPFCGKTHFVGLPFEAFISWMYNGVSVQDAFPELPADDRERLISGICPECWEEAFGPLTEN